jgi:hypothetical protein
MTVPEVLDLARRLTQVSRAGSYQYAVNVEASVMLADETSAASWAGILNPFAEGGEIERSQSMTVESGTDIVTTAVPLKAPAGSLTVNLPARTTPPRLPSIVADPVNAVGSATTGIADTSATSPTGAHT